MLAGFAFKLSLTAIIGASVTSTVTSPFSKIFGRNCYQKKDFECFIKNQLVINHCYTFNVLWIELTRGYIEENTGVPPNGRNLKCND